MLTYQQEADLRKLQEMMYRSPVCWLFCIALITGSVVLTMPYLFGQEESFA